MKIESFQNETLLPDGTMQIIGCQLMIVPQGGSHIRSIDLKLPFLEETPQISVTIKPLRTRFKIFRRQRLWFVLTDVEFHRETAHLGCKITSTNVRIRQASKVPVVCNYIIRGKPE